MPARAPTALLLALLLLQLFGSTHLTTYDSNNYMQQHEYLDNDIASMHEELSADGSRASNNLNMKHLLRFEPEFLDFKQRPVGVPHLEKVTLFNIDQNRTIDMTSISGSTVHFHSSFFEDKKIPPMGNTSFNVVFLGRKEGNIESNLFIHTTEGHFEYQVKGASIYSPYRVRPIVGVKLPLNATFSPLIYIHNPHTEPIQIVEMYSSGGDFHLELPTGELEGPRDMWEIQSLQTKAVIRVRFNSKIEVNHTAYIRIKLNNTDEILVVPLEVEVSVNSVLFEPQGYVDFGVGGSQDAPKSLKLTLHNPTRKSVQIHSITSSSKAVQVKFESGRVGPTLKGGKYDQDSVPVATLTVDWKVAFKEEDYSGRIVVKYRNGREQIEIPYYLSVLEGGVSYNSSALKYFTGEKLGELKSRPFSVQNNFYRPLMVVDYSVPSEVEQYFEVVNFKSAILKPKEDKVIFSLKPKLGTCAKDMRLDSFILLKTNISVVEIPLLSYDGKLKVHLPYKSKDNSLDLGMLSLDSVKNSYVILSNNNPVKVTLKEITTSLVSSQAAVIGCGRGNVSLALTEQNFDKLDQCTYLKPMDFAVLRLSIQTTTSEGQIWGDVTLNTQYEQVSIPVHFKVAAGTLEIGPEDLIFDKCFPGKICTLPLKIQSSFNDAMLIEDIITIPSDRRVFTKQFYQIAGKSTRTVGHIYLDPRVYCQNECYTGVNEENEHLWLRSLMLDDNTADIDLNFVNVLYNRYLNLTDDESNPYENLTMRLDTNEVKGHLFNARVKREWPKLVANNTNIVNGSYNFRLTQLGNITLQRFTVVNPSSHNLLVQLVLDELYPNLETLFEGLPPDFIPNQNPEMPNTNKNRFYFLKSPRRFERMEHDILIEDIIYERDVSQSFILAPTANKTIILAYEGEELASNIAYIVIRNNLTIIEVLRLNGRVVLPQFKFGNRKPGSLLPLTFELTDKHLTDCEKTKKSSRNVNVKVTAPVISVKRSFTARNTGEIPIHINGFLINGLECEGYGFKVLNCVPFALLPNATRKIDIAFTPDFTLAKITRNIILTTSLKTQVNYTLVTTIPPFYLDLCANLVTRPFWEPYLYYTAVVSVFTMLVFVVILPVIESEKLIKQTMLHLTRSSPPTEPLDLRSIGNQAKLEVRVPTVQKIEESEVKTDTAEKKITEEAKKQPEKYAVLIPATGKTRKKLGIKKLEEFDTVRPCKNQNRKNYEEKVNKRHKDKQNDHRSECCAKNEHTNGKTEHYNNKNDNYSVKNDYGNKTDHFNGKNEHYSIKNDYGNRIEQYSSKTDHYINKNDQCSNKNDFANRNDNFTSKIEYSICKNDYINSYSSNNKSSDVKSESSVKNEHLYLKNDNGCSKGESSVKNDNITVKSEYFTCKNDTYSAANKIESLLPKNGYYTVKNDEAMANNKECCSNGRSNARNELFTNKNKSEERNVVKSDSKVEAKAVKTSEKTDKVDSSSQNNTTTGKIEEKIVENKQETKTVVEYALRNEYGIVKDDKKTQNSKKITLKNAENNTENEDVVSLDDVKSSKKYLERKKSQPKNNNNNNNNNNTNRCAIKEIQLNNAVDVKDGKKSNKGALKSRNAKENLSGSKKHNADKAVNNAAKGETTANNSLTSSPLLNTNYGIWGETRASFSDIVSRDVVATNTTTTTSGIKLPIAKPVFGIETYGKKSDLGPIGSRRADSYYSNQEAGPAGFGNDQDTFNSLFFSDGLVTVTDETSNPFFNAVWPDNGTVEPAVDDRWMLSNTGFWDYSCPISSNNQPATPPPVSPPPQNNFIWGNSTIWNPWAPPEPSAPLAPRTPPGFGPSNSTTATINREEERQPQSYNPFGSSNIWAQQSNPWNYPQGQ